MLGMSAVLIVCSKDELWNLAFQDTGRSNGGNIVQVELEALKIFREVEIPSRSLQNEELQLRASFSKGFSEQ